MQNIKDTISTYAGLALALGTAVLALATQGIALPEWLLIAAGILAAVGGGLLGWATGKNPNLSTKSAGQVEDQNAQAK